MRTHPVPKPKRLCNAILPLQCRASNTSGHTKEDPKHGNERLDGFTALDWHLGPRPIGVFVTPSGWQFSRTKTHPNPGALCGFGGRDWIAIFERKSCQPEWASYPYIALGNMGLASFPMGDNTKPRSILVPLTLCGGMRLAIFAW